MKRMTRALAGIVGAVLALGAVGAATSLPAQAAQLQQVTNFGANPSNLGMYVYVPDNVPADAGVVVVIHYCTGSAQAMYNGMKYDELASQYGYIVIYPQATRSGACFDVSSQQALRRGGGSDPVGIASMVSYVQSRYDTDPDRVFVTGTSSGAMMTQVMLANYPDVFAAGSSFAGVPASCFATTDGSSWNSRCAQGQIDRTPAQWGDLVRAAYSGYSGYNGERPRVQLWHGTSDQTINYANFRESVDQWTNVHNLSTTPAATDTPRSGYTRTRYGSTGPQAPVEAISMAGVTHNIPVDEMEVLRFFGLTTAPDPDPEPTPDPTTDPEPTPDPTTDPTPDPDDPDPVDTCAVTYTANTWNSGFTGSLSVTNTGPTPINGWTLTWTFGGGQRVTQYWSSTVTQSGTTVTAVNAPWNGSIAPDASVQFGFNGSHPGSNPLPTGFALNGAPCLMITH